MTDVLKHFRAIIGGGGWTTRTFLPRVLDAISMCSKDNPRIGIFPTYLEDNDLPCDELTELIKLLSAQVGMDNVRSLTSNTQKKPDKNQAKELLEWADVIIIFGGLFPEMMERLRETEIDQLLLAAATSGEKIFTGSSSGMIVWFEAAQTNERTLAQARKDNNEFHDREYHWESGLGLIPALVGPHYSEFNLRTGRSRSGVMEQDMLDQPIGTVAVGVHTNASLLIDNGVVSIVSDDPYAWVQRLERTKVGLMLTVHRRTDDPIPVEKFFYPST